MKFCKNCGYENHDRHKYCPVCGNCLYAEKTLSCKGKYAIPIVLVVVILVALVLITTNTRGTESAVFLETEPTKKQLSQIRSYDETGQLKVEIDFTYKQQNVTHILIKSFSELGLKSDGQDYPIVYDTDGRVIRYGIPGEGRYEEFEYDAEGTLIRHGEGEGGYAETFYEYDAQGRLAESLTSGEGADYVSHYVYDNTGRCTRRDDYSYYDATYSEDRTYDLEVYHYKYDELGNLTEISGDSTITTYEYDDLGRKTSEVMKDEYGFTYTTFYTYDYAGLTVCDVNYNNNSNFNKGYCMAELRDATGFLIYSYGFDTGSVLSANPEGYLSHIVEPTGARTEFRYMEFE